jgi:hypothetical protein
VHVVLRCRWNWSQKIATFLDGPLPLLEAWRSSPSFDAADAISDVAKSRTLLVRIAEERRAQ